MRGRMNAPPRNSLLVAWAGIALTPTVIVIASILAPRLRPSPAVADLIAFVGATGTALASLVLLSKAPVVRWTRRGLCAAAVVALIFVGATRATSTLAAVSVAFGLLILAHAIGDFVGEHIEHPGHLFPACVVASAADIVSVVHPKGPSHAVASSARALELMAMSFPVMGTSEHAPTIGIGDLLFVALLLGAARRHGLSRARATILIAAGIALSGLLSAWLSTAVPALPAVGLAVVVGIAPARALRRRDRTVAAVFMVGAVVVAVGVLVLRFLAAGAQP